MERNQEIELELTNHCNLSCSTCTRDFEASRGVMSKDVFRSIFLDQDLPKNIKGICIAGFGEPLMNPNAAQFIRELKQKYPDVFLLLYTNGVLLHREATRDEILEAGLDELSISFICDGADLSTYAKMMGISPEKTIELIKKLLGRRDAISSQTRIGVSNVMQRFYADEKGEEYRSFFKKIGTDFARTPLSHNRGGNVGMNPNPRLEQITRCDFYDDVFYITWDGKASICHADIHRSVVLGDYTQQTFGQIYRAKQSVREKILSSDMCRICDAQEMKSIGDRMNSRYE